MSTFERSTKRPRSDLDEDQGMASTDFGAPKAPSCFLHRLPEAAHTAVAAFLATGCIMRLCQASRSTMTAYVNRQTKVTLDWSAAAPPLDEPEWLRRRAALNSMLERREGLHLLRVPPVPPCPDGHAAIREKLRTALSCALRCLHDRRLRRVEAAAEWQSEIARAAGYGALPSLTHLSLGSEDFYEHKRSLEGGVCPQLEELELRLEGTATRYHEQVEVVSRVLQARERVGCARLKRLVLAGCDGDTVTHRLLQVALLNKDSGAAEKVEASSTRPRPTLTSLPQVTHDIIASYLPLWSLHRLMETSRDLLSGYGDQQTELTLYSPGRIALIPSGWYRRRRALASLLLRRSRVELLRLVKSEENRFKLDMKLIVALGEALMGRMLTQFEYVNHAAVHPTAPRGLPSLAELSISVSNLPLIAPWSSVLFSRWRSLVLELYLWWKNDAQLERVVLALTEWGERGSLQKLKISALADKYARRVLSSMACAALEELQVQIAWWQMHQLVELDCALTEFLLDRSSHLRVFKVSGSRYQDQFTFIGVLGAGVAPCLEVLVIEGVRVHRDALRRLAEGLHSGVCLLNLKQLTLGSYVEGELLLQGMAAGAGLRQLTRLHLHNQSSAAHDMLADALEAGSLPCLEHLCTNMLPAKLAHVLGAMTSHTLRSLEVPFEDTDETVDALRLGVGAHVTKLGLPEFADDARRAAVTRAFADGVFLSLVELDLQAFSAPRVVPILKAIQAGACPSLRSLCLDMSLRKNELPFLAPDVRFNSALPLKKLALTGSLSRRTLEHMFSIDKLGTSLGQLEVLELCDVEEYDEETSCLTSLAIASYAGLLPSLKTIEPIQCMETMPVLLACFKLLRSKRSPHLDALRLFGHEEEILEVVIEDHLNEFGVELEPHDVHVQERVQEHRYVLADYERLAAIKRSQRVYR